MKLKEQTGVLSVDLALDWLIHSGIYQEEGPAAGAVAQGYDWQLGEYTFLYCEITGYAISTFVAAYQWTHRPDFLEYAQRSAAFLMQAQQASPPAVAGAIPHSFSLPELQPRRKYYSFDAAMCLQGFCHLYEQAPDEALYTAACQLGDWLVNHMQQEKGAFLAHYDAEANEWEHSGLAFYDDYGALHAKHAISLLHLAAITHDARYTDSARRVLDWVLTLQQSDGAIQANAQQSNIVTHAHCYAMEGLLYGYHVLQDARYLQAAQRAGDWLLQACNRDGSISIEYKQRLHTMGRRIIEKVFPKRVTDASAQAVRLWVLLYHLTGDERYHQACEQTILFLRRMQSRTIQDVRSFGALYFWHGHPIMFTWPTLFMAQAVYAHAHIDAPNAYDTLIQQLF